MEDSFYIDKLVLLIKDAAHSAKCTKDTLFQDDPIKDSSLFALAHLNRAISRMSAAESLYYSQYEVLNRQEIEHIFHTFDVFSSEVLTSLSTGHSLQWTDIEYDRFTQSLDFINDR